MCGIAGFVGEESSPRGPRSERVAAMCDAIRHRGPDDGGQYVDDYAALGMRRLSIIDLATGHQPMANEDETLWIVFNGEIYNFQPLARELQQRGHRFRTSSDTEVIVHAWEEWGEEALSRLHGMFGIAVWDRRSRTLWLARDRAGIKPLHYAEVNGGLQFASEIKSLLVDPAFPRAMDLHALDHYCSFLYTPGDRSIFSAVRKLPPAHVLRWQGGVTTVSRYWDLPRGEEFRGSEREAAAALREALAAAVKSHMISDVPLGAFLSGGVDSSTVVALMAQASSSPVKTFSIGFDEASYDELAFARVVAARFGTEHHEFVVRPDALSIVDRLIAHFDEPFGDSSAIPTWYVSEIARKHVTVVLSGDGGDELFGGYERYLPHHRVQAFDRLRFPAKRQLADLALRGWPRRARGRNFLRHVSRTQEGRYLDAVGFFRPDEKEELYTPWLASVLAGSDAETRAARSFDGGSELPWASRMMRFDFRTYLPEDVLTKVDRMSMAHSIESRVPLLDTGVIELAASFPPGLKLKGSRQKHVLKEAVADLLPASILDRRKQGFGVPVGHWFRGNLKEFFTDTLLSSQARSRGLFQPRAVERMVADHVRGRRDHTLRLWLLVVLELWQRQYVDAAVEAHAA